MSRELKSDLEREARRKLSLSAVLDLAAGEWLRNTAVSTESEQEQQRLRQAAAVTLDPWPAQTPRALRTRVIPFKTGSGNGMTANALIEPEPKILPMQRSCISRIGKAK